MKRKITACLAAVMLLLSVAGCRQGDFDNASSKGNADAAPNSKQTSSYTAKQQSDIDFIIDSDRYFVGFDEYGDAIGANGIVEDGIYKSKKAGIEFDIREWPAEDEEDFFRLEIAVVSCSFMSRVETGRKFLTVAFDSLYTGVEKDDEYNREEESLQIARNVENIIEAYKEQGYDLIEERAYESEIAGRRCQSVLLSCEELDMKMSVNYYIVHTDRYRDGVIIITADESEQKIEQTLSSIRPFRHSA